MSVTQPPPSSVPVRRRRTPSKTSRTTFARRRDQRGASAVLSCRGLLGFACRFRRFSSSAPFGFSSLVAARRLFDFVVIINTKLSVLLTFAEPTRFCRRRSVSILPRFDAFSSRNRFETFTLPRAFVVDAPFGWERFLGGERVAAPSFWEATRRPNLGEIPK